MRDPLGLCGTVLEGRYRVDAVVGEGGFGVVYRGIHLGLGGAVAIKALKLDALAPQNDRERVLEAFDAEGKLLFSLAQRHPAFARVLDRGLVTRRALSAGTLPTGDYLEALSTGAEEPLFPYLVLEWLDGETLGEELARRRETHAPPRSLAEVIDLLAPIAEALGVVHEERVAHRDVKPSNLFLVRGSAGVRVKLLDFGVAKMMSQSSTDPQDEPTGAKRAAFTPNYAAPEQWLKSYGATGPWTDVYALALMCVELLTNKPALEGDDPGQLMGATFAPVRPTPRSRGVATNDAVHAVFEHALALKPEDRFRSATEFWDALMTAESLDAHDAAPTARAAGAGETPDAAHTKSASGPKTATAMSVPTAATSSARRRNPRTRTASAPTLKSPSGKDTAQPGGAAPADAAPEQAANDAAAPEHDDEHPPESNDAVESARPGQRLMRFGGWGVLLAGLAVGTVLLARNMSDERRGAGATSSGEGSNHGPGSGDALAAGGSPAGAGATDSGASPNASGPLVPSSSSATPALSGSGTVTPPPGPSGLGANGCPDEMVLFQGGSLLGTRVAPFCLDPTEVTVAAYEQCVVMGRCAPSGGALEMYDHALLKYPTDERLLAKWQKACNRGKDRYPMNCVNWSDARAYCEAAGKRLPAYTEWKFAECPTPKLIYPWGRDLPAPFYANLCGTECAGATKPEQLSYSDPWVHSGVVASTRKLPQGVYDMAGNVAEWVDGTGEKKYALGSHFLDARVDSLGCGAQRLVDGRNKAPNVGFRCAVDPRAP